MEVCHPSPSTAAANMNLLDQIFGTDGRNKKDEGIWNWVKNQKIKSKTKSKDKHQLLTRSHTSSPESTHSTYAGSALSTVCASSSVPASSTVSITSFTCSPTSPTSSFTPSHVHAPSSTTSKSSSTTMLSTPASPTETDASSSYSSLSSSTPPPVDYSRQRAQSAFVLPTQSPPSSFGEGPIKRSTSSRSAPTRMHYISNRNNSSDNNKPHGRSMSHGDLENQGRLTKSKISNTMDEISETTGLFFSSGSVLSAINQTFVTVAQVIEAVPGSAIVINYIKNSYQNDPFRVVLEAGLAIYAVKYMLSKKYRIDHTQISLTEKEIDELVAEWQPEPLTQPLSDIQRMELKSTTMIVGAQGPKPELVNGKSLLNLASANYLDYISNNDMKEKAIETLHNYGVGSCGPPGFYGTLDVHINLEKDIAHFLGTESAIIYAQGLSTMSSVIAAFSKRGDIIVADDGSNFAIQKGTQISRSNIKWFKHNDMADLERVLQSIQKEIKPSKKRPLTRRFIVTEGLFQNYGDVAPLDKIMELKHKYKYRVILDESNSFGLLGKTGRGLTEVYNIDAKEVDMIVGSMANTLASSGGFCAGPKEVVEHQRLSGQAFVFSASIPAMLAVCASQAIKILESGKGEPLLNNLNENASAFRKVIVSAPQTIEVSSDATSPIVHLRFPQKSLDVAGITTRDEEKYLLQAVVDEVAAKDGVLVTRAKYVESQELFLPRPSIRISLCTSHTRKEVEAAAQAIKAAFAKALSSRKQKN
ncbi:serine palmitoyltransferase component [Mortierella sp. AM989]|nr:serine palmitoyltransferase component [Mortierella sp. AM989]